MRTRACIGRIGILRLFLTAGGVSAFIGDGVALAEGFVPTGFGGSLSYGYGYNRVQTSESETAALVLSMNMGGYIWEPWFMTSNFGVSLGISESDSNTGMGTVSKSIGGSVDMTLFPISRFPTSLGFSVSDSRQELKENPAIQGQDYQIRRFYLRQLYNAPSGYTVSGFYSQSTVVISGRDDQAIDRSFGVQLRRRLSYHDFEFDTNYFINEPAETTAEFRTLNVLLAHNYFPTAEVGVNSLMNYSSSETAGDASGAQFSYEQLSSSFYWRPEHRPYFMSGGVRVFQIDTASTSRGVSTNANASYRLTRNFNLGASVNVSVSDSDGNQSTDSSQSLTAGYFSDSFNIMGFDWGWSTSTSFSNSISRSDQASSGAESETGEDVQSVGVSLSHRLFRVWSLGRYSSLNFGFGQGANANRVSTSEDVPINVSNSASTGWNSYAFGGSTAVNVSVSDSRSYGDQESNFQVASVQLGRNQEISRLSSLSGSASFQTSRSTAVTNPLSDETKTTTSKSASASLFYAHSRFVGIHNLSFSSQLIFPSLLGTQTRSAQSTAEWTNTWNYHVGLLQLTLIARTQETGAGQRAYSGSFQAIRTF